MRPVILALLVLAAIGGTAERVVLLEDFTNCGCGYCWNFEPTLNSFVNTHLAAGDLSVIRVHVSWPDPSDPIYTANPNQQNARKTFYGVNGVPWVQMDGVIHAQSSASGLQNAFNNRINVPSHLKILLSREGDDQTGTITVGLIAEQDLEEQATLRLFSTVVEDDVPGAGYWSGTYFDQAFRDNLFGVAGPVVEFSEPYPDTVYLDADYDISAWNSDNLYLATFVQEYSSNYKEVMNAGYDKFMDIGTAVGRSSAPRDYVDLTVSPNPVVVTAQIGVVLPQGGQGTVEVYDVAGRLVQSWSARGSETRCLRIDEPGVYLARLVGERQTVSRRFVVLR
ncbi:T9SS type A sorting domain-containing protein [Candidatus Fermentibacteria bacterium]|nr:T9SS type A sorting domain-containing protein [Candidatus Fermentibacteria bacterium]